MTAAIYYFSGTGNTKLVSEQMKQHLERLNYDVLLKSIEEEGHDFDVDLLILGGPIYAGNMPEKMIRWVLKNVPEGNCDSIVFTSSAGLKNAFGTLSIGDKLIKKGYTLKGTLKYQMPRNYYFDNYEATSYEESLKDIRQMIESVPEDLNSTLGAKAIEIDEKLLGKDLLEEVMSLMTRFMGKNYAISDHCIHCGLCEKSCPTGNIDLSSKKNFKLKCMMCTRCLHTCPVNAITYKKEKQVQYQLNTLLKEV